MSDHQRATILESDDEYNLGMIDLIEKVRCGEVTRRKFITTRERLIQRALTRYYKANHPGELRVAA